MRVERRGATAIWTLDRPAAHNALDQATFDALDAALRDAAADPSLRAVVLAAEGSTFAAGGDLRELRTALGPEDALRVAERGRRTCDAIGALPVPVFAAIQGPAIGGGAELAIACDLRVASGRGSLCFKHAAMGVTTAWGVLPRLVALAGASTASRLLFTAQTIEAADAYRLGLFDAVAPAPAGDALALALTWAADVEKAAPGAVAALKRLVRVAPGSEIVRDHEREAFLQTWTSADHAEAVEAFFGRRAPRWTGR